MSCIKFLTDTRLNIRMILKQSKKKKQQTNCQNCIGTVKYTHVVVSIAKGTHTLHNWRDIHTYTHQKFNCLPRAKDNFFCDSSYRNEAHLQNKILNEI